MQCTLFKSYVRSRLKQTNTRLRPERNCPTINMSTSFFLPHLHTMPSLHQRLTLLHELLAVLCILTTSQHQTKTTILPTILTAHSASSSQRRLTLLHELLVVLCTLTISKNRTIQRSCLRYRLRTRHHSGQWSTWHQQHGTFTVDTVLVSGCERHL
jgi:hypothetical protein